MKTDMSASEMKKDFPIGPGQAGMTQFRYLGAGLIVAVIIIVMVILSFGSRTCADENIPVTCYKDGSRIGTATVFDWRKAASTCNTVLYDCRGECIGCFLDSDFINNVCLDMQGNEFLR